MDDLSEKIAQLLSDEESMRKLGQMAAMFGLGNAGEKEAAPPAPAQEESALQLTKFMPLIHALQSASVESQDAALLRALRPYLSPEKQRRADDAMRLLKLLSILPAVRDAGLLEGVLG